MIKTVASYSTSIYSSSIYPTTFDEVHRNFENGVVFFSIQNLTLQQATFEGFFITYERYCCPQPKKRYFTYDLFL